MQALSPEEAFRIIGREDLLTKTGSSDEEYSFKDRNATFRSFVTAYVKQADDRTLRMCADHAAFWKIADECQEAVRKLGEWRLPDTPDHVFALVKGDGEGRIRKFASYDKDSTFEAAIAFCDQRPNMPLEWRKEAACRLLARARAHGTELPKYAEDQLHKSACLGYPTEESLEASMVCRINAIKNTQLNEKLAEAMCGMIDNPSARYDDELVKAAIDMLEGVDVEAGLTDRYGDDISLPEDMIETTTNDLAKLAGISKYAAKLVNGKTVDIMGLSKEALAAVDPKLAAMSQDELAEVLPTLPKGDADLLMRMI